MLSKKIGVLSESLTIAISSKAKEMKADGKDVISFSAGEPDFDTPNVIKDAVKRALDNGCGKYTPVPGTPEVLEAIATKLKRDNGLEYKTSQIITNVGAKHSLFNVFQCIIDEGDEVIIASPYWVSYPEIVKFSGGTPVIVQTDESSKFKLTSEALKKAITPKTKAIVLNSPSNPCGGVYTKTELEAIAKVLEGTNIVVLSDEIYEKLTYNGEFVATASISPDMFKRTITINGLSKCGAMPGWRFGYMASNIDELNKAVRKLQSQSTSNISSIVQCGAVPALLGEADKDIEFMRSKFIERRDYAVDAINGIKGLNVVKPDGAFYLFVNCKEVEPDSMKFCQELLEKALVATVPGIGFGMDGYFRLSFACDMDSIKKGIDKIAKFVESYKK
ncbi:pyridoxal phosphate-dependent aminotransferase [Campylobacter hyointestinalis]|uniref:pyridoxal phosphate-dependent aminotransferase n=1 Tax=Campylobacter hyointestinalis TaxID=198 RepID=UPI000DCF1520|nr:pyridoxal phosphate-dependent aminotransferase [Campylobacter hyointestinalis]RAZ56481.1 pyridoxal phosphate-dependent aminotransferase [Campylobacter hyointestinalis subsp. lawsonii]RAZ64586.1 pyridoxal phosphate-dependent aminotransferase [Campylobacter hyointestinalis subsp. lawsonii]